MNAIAFNGVRTIVSRSVSYIGIGERQFPLLIPAVPIGEPCIPAADLVWALAQAIDYETAKEKAKELVGTLRAGGVPHERLQALIAEGYGCVDTVSTSVAVPLVDIVYGSATAEKFTSLVAAATEKGDLADGKGGDIARFESLTAIHRCAPKDKRRGKGPGHWYRWRGKDMAAITNGKGVWRIEGGEWMASHELALDYASWLFPRFLIWMIDLIPKGAAMAMMEQCLGVRFVTIDEPKARPTLTLVHDADAPKE